MILNYFQNAGKLTIALNFLLPLISVIIASTQFSPGLSICLGEGYRNFLSTELDMCNYSNSIGKYACKLFYLIQAILMSNFIDIYLTYFIWKAINRQNEAAKIIIGVNAYISRKKYVQTTQYVYNKKFPYKCIVPINCNIFDPFYLSCLEKDKKRTFL